MAQPSPAADEVTLEFFKHFDILDHDERMADYAVKVTRIPTIFQPSEKSS